MSPLRVLGMKKGERENSSLVSYIRELKQRDGDSSENIAKKMNLRPFKLYHVYLEPFNLSNARQMPYGSSIRPFCLFSTEKALSKSRFFWRESTLPISY